MVVTRSMTKKGGGFNWKTFILKKNTVIVEENFLPRKRERIHIRDVGKKADQSSLPSEYMEIPSTDDEFSSDSGDHKKNTHETSVSSDDHANSSVGSEDEIELIMNYNDSSTVNESDHPFSPLDNDKDEYENVNYFEDNDVEEDDNQDEDYTKKKDENSKDFDSDDYEYDEEFDLAMISEDWMKTKFHNAMFSVDISRLLSFGKNRHISIEWMEDIQNTKIVINDIKYCTGRNCCAKLRKAIMVYENMQQFFNDQKKRREISLNEIFSFWNDSSN
ncbi:hypothetical protein BDK51DRAFT_34292 [Blyttiomyces helicus]|uniref:Uncharacterized protein n=1 Tax=Blyttiomyces helicus TaxID=388810 RepID=A0A4P9W3E2_9FUNG|nr:hypothetical protein BDK51DRAFT_34292 [Blyttiomyces helicus]|eukprot:RKO85298.1 hypothetical protein BDK51DRAFT_34292 [Blyttiomyces helicus]